jgi:hypothetical protein
MSKREGKDMVRYRLVASCLLLSFLTAVQILFAEGCIKPKSNTSAGTQNSGVSSDNAAQQAAATLPSSERSGGPLQSSPGDRSGSQTGQPVITYGAYALWTGKWETTFFKYGGKPHTAIWELKQVESKVTGTYDWDNGRFDGRQSKTSGLMVGTWSESPTYKPPDDAGDIELQQSQDGNSFTGKWRYGMSGDWSGEWNGKRIR